MAVSQANLRDRVLRKLGVLSEDQAATSYHAAQVYEAYDAVYARLATHSAIAWPKTTRTALEIPAEVTNPLVRLLAAELTDQFGTPEPTAQRILMEAPMAEMDLRAAIANDYVPAETQAEHY